MMHGIDSLPFSEPINLLQELFSSAIHTADPMLRVPDHLPSRPAGRILVVGAGKASARMAEAVESQWGPCEGLVVTRYGYGRPCQGIEIIEAAHPVPDEAGALATARMLDLLSDTAADDFVLSLISGGGSALLTLPAGRISQQEKQEINASLLASGAPIDQMNIVRKHLSRVKAGRLAAATYPAAHLALLISDVPGDKPSDIASGPTVGETSTPADALEIIERYNLPFASSVRDVLLGPSTVIKPGSAQLSKTENIIVAAPSQSLESAATIATKRGISVQMLGHDLEGEARDLGRQQALLALSIQQKMHLGDSPILLLSGGECTVTRTGDGSGGPNAEVMLSAAISLDGAEGIHAIAGDTDGVDGAAEVAGAIIGPDTLQKSQSKNLVATQFLNNNDSHCFFEKIGDQVITGPTLTNVNDFRAFLIEPI